MQESAKRSQVLILDGGLGTTLEDVFHKDISHALWSAKPIDEDPEVIIAAHLAFLRAGANVILTSTYQCAYNTFERAGYSREAAKRIMLKSVELAQEAKRRFLDETDRATHAAVPPPPPVVKIALSLGPFGATLSPAQEFDGFYPPPFGPDTSHPGERTNAFEETTEGRAQEQAAIDALTDFHHERLCVYGDDEETWNTIDFIAFETVPLRREVYAIRAAVARFVEARRRMDPRWQMKPWWISTDYPDGRYPEMKAGGRLAATEVADAVLDEERGAAVWGFGINCTKLEFLRGLLADTRHAAQKYREKNGGRPWLILYPNGGDVYDPETQSWRKQDMERSTWAKDLCAIVLEGLRSGDWEGVIVGGCCKTGPEEIKGLTKELRVWL